MPQQLETQGPREQPRWESRCGRREEVHSGADSLAQCPGQSDTHWLSQCPGDRQPESPVTSVVRNIPKQEFCLLRNHGSLVASVAYVRVLAGVTPRHQAGRLRRQICRPPVTASQNPASCRDTQCTVPHSDVLPIPPCPLPFISLLLLNCVHTPVLRHMWSFL